MKSHFRFLRIFVLIGVISWVEALRAQLPQPRLWTVFPPGLSVGGTGEVNVQGGDLDGELRLVFSDDRITAKSKKDGDGKPVPRVFDVTVGEGVDPGYYEVWAIGKFGMSNSRRFAVGTLSEQLDAAPQHDLKSALPLSMGTTVSGRVVANQKNVYRIFAQKGQRVMGVLAGEEIDSRLEPVLELRNASGRLVRKDRTGRLLDYVPESTGPLFLSVHDLTYRGGEQYFYRLTVHSGGHVDFVLPLSVSLTETPVVHVFGRNFSPDFGVSDPSSGVGGLEHVRIELLDLDRIRGAKSQLGIRHSVPGFFGRPSFVVPFGGEIQGGQGSRLGLTRLSSSVEMNLVGKTNRIQSVELPLRISGLFYPRLDEDLYEFEAKQGEELWIEVISSRLGYSTHPLVIVERMMQDESGAWLGTQVMELSKATRDIGERALPLRSRDPAGLLKVKKDGRYRVSVSDRFNLSRDQASRPYELVIRRPQPSVRAYSVYRPTLHRNVNRKASVESSSLMPGQVLPVPVKLDPSEGFSKSVSILAPSAPDGVTVYPLRIPAGKSQGVLFVAADLNAEPISGDLKLVGRVDDPAATDSISVEHAQVIWEVGDYNNEAVLSRLSPERKVSISPGASFPIRIQAEGGADERWRSSVAGKISIPIELSRQEGFADAYTFKIGGHDALAKHPGLTVKKGENRGHLELDLLESPLDPGLHSFYLYGEVKGKFTRDAGGGAKDVTVSAYSHPLQLEVLPAPFAFETANANLAIRRGESKRIRIKLVREFGFEGQIEVASEFEPAGDGVTVSTGMLQDDQFSLTLSVSETAPVKDLRLKLTAQGKLNGKRVSTEHRILLGIVE